MGLAGRHPTGAATGIGAFAGAGHTHALTFADLGHVFEDGSYTQNIQYQYGTGGAISGVAETNVHPETGGAVVNATNMGKSPYPARADHSHRLNVPDIVVEGATAGGYLRNGATAAFGEKNYYARIDHVHPAATGAGTPVDLTTGTVGGGGGTNPLWTLANNGSLGNGCMFLVITRIIPTGDPYERNVFYAIATIGNRGNIVNIGPEIGHMVAFVGNSLGS